jgi:hypothetical protein
MCVCECATRESHHRDSTRALTELDFPTKSGQPAFVWLRSGAKCLCRILRKCRSTREALFESIGRDPFSIVRRPLSGTNDGFNYRGISRRYSHMGCQANAAGGYGRRQLQHGLLIGSWNPPLRYRRIRFTGGRVDGDNHRWHNYTQPRRPYVALGF